MILDEFEAAKAMSSAKAVFISGSFDLLHYGHIHFFKVVKARFPDHKIVVAVLPDDQIRLRKGEGRPLITQDIRCECVDALKTVDITIAWSQSWQALREYVLFARPSVLAVVSGDPGLLNKKQVITDAGGKLYIADKFENFSTSALLEQLANEEL